MVGAVTVEDHAGTHGPSALALDSQEAGLGDMNGQVEGVAGAEWDEHVQSASNQAVENGRLRGISSRC
jgi:hypothetical protein